MARRVVFGRRFDSRRITLAAYPYYQNGYGWKVEDYPVATKIGRHTISLPLSPSLKDDDQKYVINALHEILG